MKLIKLVITKLPLTVSVNKIIVFGNNKIKENKKTFLQEVKKEEMLKI